MSVALSAFLLSTAVIDDAKVAWLVQTVEAQSARLDDQARQIAALQEQLAELTSGPAVPPQGACQLGDPSRARRESRRCPRA